MRYFLQLAYKGTHFNGWQRQPDAPSVQAALETALQTLFRTPTEVTGCGRTDTGVHAQHYVAHFDGPAALPSQFLYSLNSILPYSVGVFSVKAMLPDAHARFDATERQYIYRIVTRKDPFAQETAWYVPTFPTTQWADLQSVADLLGHYQSFYPFCKTHSGVAHYTCRLTFAQWQWHEDTHEAYFHIHGNRFLRGMVRLVVGTCLSVARGQMSLAQVQHALDTQTALPKSLSVPPQGLALTKIIYPYEIG